MNLPPDVEKPFIEVRTFVQIIKDDKRIWIALAVAGFIGFVAGAWLL